MFSTSHLEISESTFKGNLTFLKHLIGQKTRFCLVIKGNAYGHGVEPIIQLAEKHGINHFSCFSAEEAYEAHAFKSPNSHLTIMGHIDHHAYDWVIKNGHSFHLFDSSQLPQVIESAKRVGLPARIHLDLETGMNRTGLEEAEMGIWIPQIKKNLDHLHVEGTCSHMAGAENIANHVRVTSQIEKYHRLCDHLKAEGIALGTKHLSSSAGCFCYPETMLDQARIGISAYGFWPTQEVKMRYLVENDLVDPLQMTTPLHRIISWKTKIMSIKHVSIGQFVGYGSSFLTSRPLRIAVIPVGYRDGFARAFSNRGRVLIGGRRCSVVGTVNMNMALVDVTSVQNPCIGDEVVLIGRQGESEMTVSSFSDISDELNYEILVRLPSNIPRHIIP